MNNIKYNGWTNYATWRVNLEIFDGINPSDFWEMDRADITDTLPNDLKYYVKDWFEQEALDAKNKGIDVSLMCDYAMAFLSEVNWYEIAKHMIDDHVSENLMEEV